MTVDTPTLVTLLGGLATFVAGCFRWLAKRDDRREAERTAERNEFQDTLVKALGQQQVACEREMKRLVDAFVAERALDRELIREFLPKP